MAEQEPALLARRCAEAMLERDRASASLGMALLAAAPGQATVSMRVRDDMIQGHGTCHGGFIFSLADTAFALACNSYDQATVGLGCNIDYIAPGRHGDTLVATCVEQSRAGRTGSYHVRVEDQNGRLVALFNGRSYSVNGSVLASGELQ